MLSAYSQHFPSSGSTSGLSMNSLRIDAPAYYPKSFRAVPPPGLRPVELPSMVTPGKCLTSYPTFIGMRPASPTTPWSQQTAPRAKRVATDGLATRVNFVTVVSKSPYSTKPASVSATHAMRKDLALFVPIPIRPEPRLPPLSPRSPTRVHPELSYAVLKYRESLFGGEQAVIIAHAKGMADVISSIKRVASSSAVESIYGVPYKNILAGYLATKEHAAYLEAKRRAAAKLNEGKA